MACDVVVEAEEKIIVQKEGGGKKRKREGNTKKGGDEEEDDDDGRNKRGDFRPWAKEALTQGILDKNRNGWTKKNLVREGILDQKNGWNKEQQRQCIEYPSSLDRDNLGRNRDQNGWTEKLVQDEVLDQKRNVWTNDQPALESRLSSESEQNYPDSLVDNGRNKTKNGWTEKEIRKESEGEIIDTQRLLFNEGQQSSIVGEDLRGDSDKNGWPKKPEDGLSSNINNGCYKLVDDTSGEQSPVKKPMEPPELNDVKKNKSSRTKQQGSPEEKELNKNKKNFKKRSDDEESDRRRNYKNMTRERRMEANARERTRVHTISAAFETLRRAVPSYSHSQKLSKLSVLRVAASYILTLSRVVGKDYSADSSRPSIERCVDNVSNTIQMEGKLRRKKDD